MKVVDLFEAKEKDPGTLEIVPQEEGFMVRCTERAGVMKLGLYKVWKAVMKKRGAKVTVNAGRVGAVIEPTMQFFISKQPMRIMVTGVSKEVLQAIVDKVIAEMLKSHAEDVAFKAKAPERKAAAAKYQAEKRKQVLADYDVKYGKGTWNRVTYKQEGGDDGYSYALRVDGRVTYNGLTQREAAFRKEQAVKEIAKREKLGMYADKAPE